MKTFVRPVLSAANDTFVSLAAMHIGFHLILAKMDSGMKGFIALECPDEDTLLSTAKLSAGKSGAVYLRRGLPIQRRVDRRAGNVPGNTRSTLGHRSMSLLRQSASLENLMRSMAQGDYVRLRVTPIENPLAFHPGFTDETNAAFLGDRCVDFDLDVSCASVADALISDLAATDAAFCIGDAETASHSTRRLGSHTLTVCELRLLMQGFDALFAELFPSTVHSLMMPSQAANMPTPDIVLGHNSGVPVGISFETLATNLALLGLPNSGKTTLEKQIVAQLIQAGIPVLVLSPVKFDWSEAFGHMCNLYRSGDDEHPLRFNLLDLNRRRESVPIAASALSRITPMGDNSFLPMIYQNTLEGLYADEDAEISLADLSRAAMAEFDMGGYAQGRDGQSLKQAIVNRPKNAYGKAELSCGRSNIDFDRMIRTPSLLTLIELHAMEDSARRAFASIFLQRLMQAYRSVPTDKTNLPLRFVIVLDELHELLSPTPDQDDPFRVSLTSSLVTARGLGVAHVLCDQRLSVLGEIADHGCASQIVLNNPPTAQCASMLGLPLDSAPMQQLPYVLWRG